MWIVFARYGYGAGEKRNGRLREEAVDKIFWVDGSENVRPMSAKTGSAGRCGCFGDAPEDRRSVLWDYIDLILGNAVLRECSLDRMLQVARDTNARGWFTPIITKCGTGRRSETPGDRQSRRAACATISISGRFCCTDGRAETSRRTDGTRLPFRRAYDLRLRVCRDLLVHINEYLF